jgi:hypothetical protein
LNGIEGMNDGLHIEVLIAGEYVEVGVCVRFVLEVAIASDLALIWRRCFSIGFIMREQPEDPRSTVSI